MAQKLDSKVSSVLDNHPSTSLDSDDEDHLLNALETETENDPAFAHLREQRLQQLHAEFARAKSQRNEGFGTFEEVKDEKSLMDLTTSTKWIVVHFFKPDFHRCGVMDRHLETLAPKHFDTRFVRINVENAPFLVVKLKIQVLPCVLAFVDGKSVDRVVGFDGLAHNPDSFTTRDLEARLLASGVLLRAKAQAGGNQPRGIFGKVQQRKEDSDENDD